MPSHRHPSEDTYVNETLKLQIAALANSSDFQRRFIAFAAEHIGVAPKQFGQRLRVVFTGRAPSASMALLMDRFFSSGAWRAIPAVSFGGITYVVAADHLAAVRAFVGRLPESLQYRLSEVELRSGTLELKFRAQQFSPKSESVADVSRALTAFYEDLGRPGFQPNVSIDGIEGSVVIIDQPIWGNYPEWAGDADADGICTIVSAATAMAIAVSPNPEKYLDAGYVRIAQNLLLSDGRGQLDIIMALEVMHQCRAEFEPHYSTRVLPALRSVAAKFKLIERDYKKWINKVNGSKNSTPSFPAPAIRLARSMVVDLTPVLEPLIVPFLQRLSEAKGPHASKEAGRRK